MMGEGRSTASAFAYGRAGCDPPFQLLESLTKTMQKVDSEPEFVLVTGDIAPHYLPSRRLVLESLNTVAQHLAVTICGNRSRREERSQRRPKCVIAIGNVDLFPTLYIPEESDTPDAIDTNTTDDSDPVRFSDLYNIYAKAGLIDSMDDDLRKSFITGGYYRAYDDPELRILVYNSLHYVSNRLFRVDLPAEGSFQSQAKKYSVVPCSEWGKILAKTSDPAGQLAWLDRELAGSERSGQSVFLVSHIGPGSKLGMRSWCERYAKSFANLLRKYNKTISMQFYGDLPREEMRIIDIGGSSDNQADLVGLPILMNPGLTPRRLPGGSPTFRHGFMLRRARATSSANLQLKAALQNESVILLDFHAYSFPLQNTAAERLFFGARAPAPEWRWRYSFREQYCVENMSTSNMNRLVRRIEADPDLMQAYMIRMNDGFESDIDVDRALQVLRFSP
ncbi:Acid sphingomyelinase-like phosphodiesterase 3b [Cyanidiococcus yangmingshanensis]|uniref:Acid sphingomyelinase-like phosphodiesterase 3b n=1 Tax=Cyanidiococcus yangmingshanensis TaxID=2690220 RepID=A0A7J7ICY6_9RHOD|nr:Acid sphingomyelinase-like phosphodiesterase 3b [Cyanidiococcus yangmingshanensis]